MEISKSLENKLDRLFADFNRSLKPHYDNTFLALTENCWRLAVAEAAGVYPHKLGAAAYMVREHGISVLLAVMLVKDYWHSED